MDEHTSNTELLAELAQAQKRIAELESAARVESEERFASVFRSSPAQMALTDSLTGKYVEVNEAFLRTLGFERDEVIGKTALELHLFSNSAQRAELLQRLDTQGTLHGEHVLVRCKTGEIRPGIFSAEYVHTLGQKLLLTVMNDVTEKMQAEERWQFALEGADNGVWDWNAQTDHVFFSRRWKSMLGYEENEIGNTLNEWASRVHPDDLASTIGKVNQHLAGETPSYTSEHRIRCKDGHYKWILDQGKVMEWTDDHKPLRVIGTHQDITRRKIVEEKLRQSEERFKHVFHANPSAQIIVSMADGHILDANAAFCQQTGFTMEEVIGKNTRELNLWPDPARHQEIIQHLQTGGKVHNIEIDFRTRGGEMRTILFSFDPIELNGERCIVSTGVDISDRKLAEQALHQSENQYHSLVDALDVSLCRWLPDTTLTFANEKYIKIFGVQGEAAGQRWIDFIPEERRSTTAAFYAEVAQNPRTVTYEHPVTVEGGEVREYQWIDTPIFNERGEAAEFQSVGIDITQRKRFEGQLAESERKYRELVQFAPVGIYEVDFRTLKLTSANDVICSLTGYRREELLHLSPIEILAAGDRDVFMERFHKWLAGEPLQPNSEYRIRAKDGRVLDALLNVTFTRDKEGNPLGATVITSDITERKQMERSLAESEARFRDLLNATPDAMVVANAEGKIIIANAQTGGMFGYTSNELIGKTVEELVSGRSVHMHRNSRSRFMKHPKMVTAGVDRDIFAIRKNGEEFPVEISLSHHQLADGESIVLCSIRDVTERKRSRELIAAQRDLARLASANLSKEEVWQACFQIALQVSGFDCGGLYIYNQDVHAFVITYHEGLSDNFINMVSQFKDGTPSAQMISSGKMFFLSSLDLEAQPYHGQEGLHSTAVIPIVHQEQVLGCFNLASHSLDNIPDPTRNALEAIALEVGNVIIHQQTEEALQASRKQLSQALMAARMGTWRWHLPTDRMEWSPETAQIFGADFIKQDFNSVIESFHPDDRELIAQTVQEALTHKQMMNLEYRILTGSGRTIWVTNYGNIETDASGAPMVVTGLVQDITERKLAEEALRASEENYRGLMQSLNNAICTVDYDGRFLYINDMGAASLGAKPQDLIGKSIKDIFPEPLASFQLAGIQSIFHEDRYAVYEGESLGGEGLRWYRFSFQPLHDGNGHVVQVLINATDIHDLKTTQQELENLNRTLEERVRERTAQVQDLYDSAPVGYHSLDSEGRYLEINQTELNWLGYEREELLGKPITYILTPQYAEIFSEIFLLFRASGKITNQEAEAICKNGKTFPILINATAVYNENGEYVASRSTITDNTERKQAENALRLTNAELERAMRVKDEFLASMSHELRTPLNAILGLSQSMLEQFIGPLNEHQLDCMQTIESSGSHLLELINDILDLSKVSSNQMTLEITPISASEVCQASLLFVREMAHKKHLQVASLLDPQVQTLLADERRLKQMLVNLLSNAVKFTPEGGAIQLRVTGDSEKQIIRFSVSDTGIGIAPENINRLFQPFVQLDSGLNRQFEGTGLGLSLVARMAELHGGSVSVESEPGKGSTFSILLPWVLPVSSHMVGEIMPQPSTTKTVINQLGSKEPLILIAEDNEANIAMLTTTLQARGYRLAIARNGSEALEFTRTQHPDLILMDFQMPVMNGLETTQRLRQDSDPLVANIPVLALTALAMPADRRRAIEAGANEYLSKPVNLKQLTEVMARLLGEQ